MFDCCRNWLGQGSSCKFALSTLLRGSALAEVTLCSKRTCSLLLHVIPPLTHPICYHSQSVLLNKAMEGTIKNEYSNMMCSYLCLRYLGKDKITKHFWNHFWYVQYVSVSLLLLYEDRIVCLKDTALFFLFCCYDNRLWSEAAPYYCQAYLLNNM